MSKPVFSGSIQQFDSQWLAEIFAIDTLPYHQFTIHCGANEVCGVFHSFQWNIALDLHDIRVSRLQICTGRLDSIVGTANLDTLGDDSFFTATLVISFTHRYFLLHLILGKSPKRLQNSLVFGKSETRFWELHFWETSKKRINKGKMQR